MRIAVFFSFQYLRISRDSDVFTQSHLRIIHTKGKRELSFQDDLRLKQMSMKKQRSRKWGWTEREPGEPSAKILGESVCIIANYYHNQNLLNHWYRHQHCDSPVSVHTCNQQLQQHQYSTAHTTKSTRLLHTTYAH